MTGDAIIMYRNIRHVWHIHKIAKNKITTKNMRFYLKNSCKNLEMKYNKNIDKKFEKWR